MKKLTLTVLLTLVLILTLGTTAGALAQGEGSVTTFINVNGSVRTGERATVTVTLNNAQGQRACSSAAVSFTIPREMILEAGELVQTFETIGVGENKQASIVLSGPQGTSAQPSDSQLEFGYGSEIKTDNNALPPQTGDGIKVWAIVVGATMICAAVAIAIVCILGKKMAKRVLMLGLAAVVFFGVIGYTVPVFAQAETDENIINLEASVFGDNGVEYKVQAEIRWALVDPINILIVGSGLIARDAEGAEHDVRLFFESMCEDAKVPVNVESIVRPNDYNLFESGLTGDNQSKVKEALESKVFDYVVLQMGRDYALTYDSTKTKDLTAINNIEKYLLNTNPDGKLVFFVPPYRNDMSSKFWSSYSYRKGWKTVEDHAQGIREYMDEVAQQMQSTPIYADVLGEFENKLSKGIDVFHATDVDYPSVDGSFVAAAELFRAIFGKSAYGYGSTCVTTDEGKKLAISSALAKLYGLASGDDEGDSEDDPNTVNILFVGSDLIARGGRGSTHDSRIFLQSMCEDAGIPVYMESIIRSTNYNIYENGLTGKNQSKVNSALNNKRFDYVVVQIGRDYALTTPSKADEETLALANIEKYLKATNPNGKIVFLVPIYRNNLKTAYWTSYIRENDWSTIQDHSAGIKAYVAKQAGLMSEDPIIADVLSAFENKLAQGIKVFHKDYIDYPSVDGSFITAATLFEAIFDRSVYGYGSASVTATTGETLAISNDLAAMYGIPAAQNVPTFGSKMDWSHEVITPEVEALRVVAKAFYDRKAYLQYDQLSRERVDLTAHRGNSHGIPEDATAQKLLYTDCAYFVRMCYYNAFNYDFGTAFTTSGLTKLENIRTFCWRKDDGNVDAAAQTLVDEIEPGDLIAYRNAADTNGHVMLYIGDGLLLHSTGFGSIDYNYTRKSDNYEPSGTVIYTTMDEMLNKNDELYLFRDKSIVTLLRPLQLGLTITENTKARVAGLQNIVVSKTTSHPDGVSANPGDSVTFTISVKNNDSVMRSVQITDTVPDGMTCAIGGEGTMLNWNIDLNPGETQQINYSFAVKADVEYDIMISCANTKVNGVQINDCPVYIKKTLTAEQQSSIVAAAQAVLAASDGLDLAKQAYVGAFNFELPITDMNAIFTEVFGTPSGGCVRPTLSGGQIRSMMVETIYGGQNTKTENGLLGTRTSNPVVDNMVAGDLLVFFTGSTADTGELYICLGGNNLLSVKDGSIVAYDTVCRAYGVTVSLLGQYAFCLLRPSAVMP